MPRLITRLCRRQKLEGGAVAKRTEQDLTDEFRAREQDLADGGNALELLEHTRAIRAIEEANKAKYGASSSVEVSSGY